MWQNKTRNRTNSQAGYYIEIDRIIFFLLCLRQYAIPAVAEFISGPTSIPRFIHEIPGAVSAPAPAYRAGGPTPAVLPLGRSASRAVQSLP